MYLLDTNIWLELLDQERSEEVGRFLTQIPSNQLLMSDFSLHSIGVLLGRFRRHEIFIEFAEDIFINGRVRLVSVAPA